MADWFEWNGERCTDYGIHVSVQPEVIIPNERIAQISIPGRAGSLTTTEGDQVYDDIQYSFTCFVENMHRRHDISRWLRGSGKLIIPRRRDGYYDARITNQIPFSLLLRGEEWRSFAVGFECQPFFKYNQGLKKITVNKDAPKSLNSPNYIPCLVDSYPEIKINATGDDVNVDEVYLLIDDQIMYISSFTGSISIDTLNGVAYKENADGTVDNMCANVSLGEITQGADTSAPIDTIFSPSIAFPRIKVGKPNILSVQSSSDNDRLGTVEVIPHWRTL